MNRLLFLITSLFVLGSLCPLYGTNVPPIQSYEPVVDSQYTDKSFLTGDPCFPPCWQGLTIGESTKEETMRRLAELPFVDLSNSSEQNSSYYDDTVWPSEPSTLLRVSCKDPQGETCFNLVFHNNILKQIGQTLNFTLTLEDVVNYYGPPIYIVAKPWGPECTACLIDLIWETPLVVASVADLRCNAGAKLCQSIRNGGGVPPDYVIDSLSTSIWLQQGYDAQMRLSWPGFINEE